MITHFDPAPDRFAVLRPCIESGDCGDADAEWPNNMLSRHTVVYRSGVIARRGQPVRHNVDPGELELCERLAGEAGARMRGVAVGMGSEGYDEFQEFSAAANVDDPIPQRIDERLRSEERRVGKECRARWTRSESKQRGRKRAIEAVR